MDNPHQARFGERPTTQFDVLASVIRRCLDEISSTQTLLFSTRKELLIERARMKTAAREVRQKRVDAGDAEAEFMNHVREFVNKYLGQLPATLFEAYDKVRKTRDDLGEAEEDYFHAEEDLTGAEWTFTNRENRFYQFDIIRILLSSQLNNPAPRYDQPFEVASKPPVHHLPPCPAGSLSPSQVSKLPPPPPPPHISTPSLPPVPHVSVSTSLLMPTDRENPVVMEMEALRKEFGQLSQMETYDFEWAGGDEGFCVEGNNVLGDQVTASASDHSDIILDVSDTEAKAQQIKMAELDLALNEPVLSRRYSDSTHLFSAGLIPLTPMRRTQTENVARINRCSPTVGNKIRDWSLTHLKQSAIQKRLYLNALEDNGIDSSAEGDWRTRATKFWSKDGLNEIRDSSELYAACLSKVSYEPESCNDLSSTQSITSSLLLQHQLEGNIQPPKPKTADLRPPESFELPRQDRQNGPTTAPLRPTPRPSDRNTKAMETNNEDQIVSPINSGLDGRQHVPRSDIVPDTIVRQPICTCLVVGDWALRKDSVQSTHQPGCGMATEHDDEIKACCSAQEYNEAESMTNVTKMDRRSERTQQRRSIDLHLLLPSDSGYGGNVHTEPDSDVTAQSSSPSPCAQLSTLSAPVVKETLESTADQVTPDPRPAPKARRNTMTWVRSLFLPSKDKRSKSSPSIREYHAAAHVGEHQGA